MSDSFSDFANADVDGRWAQPAPPGIRIDDRKQIDQNEECADQKVGQHLFSKTYCGSMRS